MSMNRSLQVYKHQQSQVPSELQVHGGETQVVEVLDAPRFEVFSPSSPQGGVRETYVLEREKEFHYYYGQQPEEKAPPAPAPQADPAAQLFLTGISGFVGMGGFWVVLRVFEALARGLR